MMTHNTQPIQIRNITLGEGNPKICVPIVATTREGIYAEAVQMQSLAVDIVEWRVDWYEDSKVVECVIETAEMLREILGDIPILFTIRTSTEGGETSYSRSEYSEINKTMANSNFIDMLDVELFMGDDVVTEITMEAHKCDVKVIASNHEFHMTPKKEEIIKRLLHMEALGADILKMAVMPQNTSDVITLLDATREMVEGKTKKPIVTMSMGKLGVISRVAGGTFGSAMTFGAGEKASAPGQIGANDLKHMINLL